MEHDEDCATRDGRYCDCGAEAAPPLTGCPDCDGTGEVPQDPDVGPNMAEDCETCDGTGVVLPRRRSAVSA